MLGGCRPTVDDPVLRPWAKKIVGNWYGDALSMPEERARVLMAEFESGLLAEFRAADAAGCSRRIAY